MQAIIWTAKDCPECDRIKAHLAEYEADVAEIDLDMLMKGVDKSPLNIEALAQLAAQNMAAPVLCLNGKFTDPKTIKGKS